MYSKLILLTLFIGCLFLLSFRGEQKKKKVILFGDSITELGVKPNGYVDLLQQMNNKNGNAYEFVGSGIGGNKVYDLFLRLEKDVLQHHPDIVVIYIGVNDVWHKKSFGTGTDYDKFGRFYEALVQKIQAAGSKVLVCTPAVVGERTDASNELDGDLNHYSNWIRQYSVKQQLPLVDLRQMFLDYNRQYNKENKESGVLTYDRVHLNDKGNQVVAEAVWNVMQSLK